MPDRPGTPGPWVDAYLAVGSNIEPEVHILAALDLLRKDMQVTGVSTVYRTLPIGRPEQGTFLNGVWRVAVGADVDPRWLKFDVLRPIERQLGRVRTADTYAARSIDLDVILFGDQVIDEPDLRLPDPDIRVRAFVAVPLCELAPALVLPDNGERLAAVVDGLHTGDLNPEKGVTDRLRRSIES